MRIGRNKSLNTVIGFTYLLGEDFVASHCTVAVALHWSNKFKINYECDWYSDDELQVKKKGFGLPLEIDIRKMEP